MWPRDGRHGAGLFIFAVGALLLLTGLLAVSGTPKGHSYFYNMAWFVAFEDAIGQGAIYPRHLPGLWQGLGGLDFFFYGPLPFYVAAGPARWICQGCDPQTVFGLAGGMLWGLSAVTFWAFARRFLPPLAAIVAAAVYMALPYHISIDWLMRQAVGEFAAYVFLPLVALGMDVAMRERRMGPALPIGVAGTLLCHLPTALLAAHVFATILLVWSALNMRAAGPAIARIAGMGGGGTALAAIYWLPAIFLMDDVTTTALYDAPVFNASNWLYFGTSVVPFGNLSLVVLGLLTVATIVAIVLSWTASRECLRDRYARLVWIVVPITLCVVLNTVLAKPIWESWIISRVQFPFRLMIFVDLSVALAAGYLLLDLQRVGSVKTGLRPVAVLALIVLSCAVVVSPQTRWALGSGYQMRGGDVPMGGAEEYLPQPFRDAILREAGQTSLSTPQIRSIVADWQARFGTPGSGVSAVDSTPREWLFMPKAAGPAVLAVPYWRHMRAETEGGAAVALAPDPEYGMVALEVPQGAEEIRITLPWHRSEWAGLGLSLAGLAGLAVLGWRRMRPG